MTNYSRSVLLSNGQIRGKNLRNGTLPGAKNHPQRLGFPSSEKDSLGLFTHRPQTPQRSFRGTAAGTHATPSPNRAHSGSHAETRAFQVGVVSLPSDRFARFGNPAWPGVRTAYFAAFGPWSGVLSKNTESLRNSDALMRVAVPKASRPRWAA